MSKKFGYELALELIVSNPNYELLVSQWGATSLKKSHLMMKEYSDMIEKICIEGSTLDEAIYEFFDALTTVYIDDHPLKNVYSEAELEAFALEERGYYKAQLIFA